MTTAKTKRKPTKLQRYLRKKCACAEARQWVGRKTLKKAWDTCERSDWMAWLVKTLGVAYCGCHLGRDKCRLGQLEGVIDRPQAIRELFTDDVMKAYRRIR